MSGTPKRPAHRPSRRAAVVEAAMHLYAVRPIEDVTVADIADEAGMTSAAVYYHYASKEDLLLEGLRGFANAMTDEMSRLLADGGEREGTVGDVAADLVAWMDTQRSAALVWFVNSPGLSESVEALRRVTRLEMVEAFAAGFRKRGTGLAQAEAGVNALAVVVLIEQAAIAWLTEDIVYANLGRRRFAAEVVSLGNLIASEGAATIR